MIQYDKERNGKEKKEENEYWTDNKIGAEGAKAISETMKINTTLTSLDLGGDDKIEKERNRKKERKRKWIMNS